MTDTTPAPKKKPPVERGSRVPEDQFRQVLEFERNQVAKHYNVHADSISVTYYEELEGRLIITMRLTGEAHYEVSGEPGGEVLKQLPQSFRRARPKSVGKVIL